MSPDPAILSEKALTILRIIVDRGGTYVPEIKTLEPDTVRTAGGSYDSFSHAILFFSLFARGSQESTLSIYTYNGFANQEGAKIKHSRDL